MTLPTCECLQQKEEVNTPLPKVGDPQRCFGRLETLYFPMTSPSLFCLSTLDPPCVSLSDSIKEPGIQAPIRWLLRDVSLPSIWSAGFLNKVIFFASPPLLSDSLACCVVSRASLDLVTWRCLFTQVGGVPS